MDLSSISSLSGNTINPLEQSSSRKKTSGLDQVGESFSAVLGSLNESQSNTDNLVQTLASGGDVDLHTVTIASEENDVNFRVAMAIRDKLVDAYREVMRMSV
jgi:flagellar hook-basal body complex protein FliE